MTEKIEPQKTGTELIKENLETAEARVEAEFERTGNTWLDCFGSIIFQQECLLDLRRTKEELSPEQIEKAWQDMKNLKVHYKQLKEEYPIRDTVPPAEIKSELFKKVDVLGLKDSE